MTLTTQPARAPSSPAANACTTAAGAALGMGIAEILVQTNPELVPWRPVLLPAVAGIFGGLGNIARTSGGWVKALFGWIG